MPLRSRTLACRNASPEPSASSTNPNPRSGLNHLTTARTGGPGGRVEAWRGVKRGAAAEIPQMRVVTIIVKIAAARLTEIPVSDQVRFLSSRFAARSRPRNPIVPKNRRGRECLICWAHPIEWGCTSRGSRPSGAREASIFWPPVSLSAPRIDRPWRTLNWWIMTQTPPGWRVHLRAILRFCPVQCCHKSSPFTGAGKRGSEI